MKKILLFGGNGFIGKELTNSFATESRKIDILDKDQIDLEDKYAWKHIREYIKKETYESIVILAAIKRQDGDGLLFKKRNNSITNNISRAIEDINTKVLYMSSCAVYGEQNEQSNYTETSSINPTSYYGEHKAWSEVIYKNSIRKENLLILRPPLIYSVNEKSGYHPTGLYNEAKHSGKVKIWGSGSEKREFIELRDASEIIAKLIKKQTIGTLNLTSGKSFSYKEIIEEISKHMNVITERKERNRKKVDHTYDNGKLKSIINTLEFRTPTMVINELVSRHED